MTGYGARRNELRSGSDDNGLGEVLEWNLQQRGSLDVFHANSIEQDVYSPGLRHHLSDVSIDRAFVASIHLRGLGGSALA